MSPVKDYKILAIEIYDYGNARAFFCKKGRRFQMYKFSVAIIPHQNLDFWFEKKVPTHTNYVFKKSA